MSIAYVDENLIIRMAAGDGAAFKELYEQTSSAVYGFALSILKNKHDAEDVMHDAFIKAYTAAVTYKPMGKPLAWLLTIVRNLCYSRIRAGGVCEDLSEYQDLACVDESGNVLDRLILQEALSKLDFEERQIVILHSLTGLKHREIGEIMDLPTGTVLSKYNRSLKKLKKELEGKGV
ncbi:MAG: RNA polymerase sigma factor [Mogibacterium sp.]|nr:RNA polymerase sigma factor [Mogibacterium sp.]